MGSDYLIIEKEIFHTKKSSFSKTLLFAQYYVDIYILWMHFVIYVTPQRTGGKFQADLQL